MAANGVSSTFTTLALPFAKGGVIVQLVEAVLAVVKFGRSCTFATGILTVDDTQPVGVWVVKAVYAVAPPFN